MAKGSLRNKQDRLDRLIGLLRSDGIWTTKRLCAQINASPRTLMRDLAELRDLGYPIESDRGRGGGVRLNGRWGIDRLSLSDQELINLLVSLAVSESLKSPLMASSVKSVRQKIAQSFPNRQRQMINQLRTRILIGEQASEEVIASYKTPKPEIIDPITLSFFKQRQISIQYQTEERDITDRIIDPQYLLLNWPVWYLLGWDHVREDVRLFRIDRILNAKPQTENLTLRPKKEILKGFDEYFTEI